MSFMDSDVIVGGVIQGHNCDWLKMGHSFHGCHWSVAMAVCGYGAKFDV